MFCIVKCKACRQRFSQEVCFLQRCPTCGFDTLQSETWWDAVAINIPADQWMLQLQDNFQLAVA